MILRSWDKLPEYMRTDEVRPYYDALSHHKISIVLKRVFDFVVSLFMLVILCPFGLIIALIIKLDSPGPVFFFQERVTTYGKRFMIWKFRTMVNDAERVGTQITMSNDWRVTKVGRVLRDLRLDEFPQLVNILMGDMSFVGTRPEVVKYVDRYEPVFYATLLMPAGATSEASIRYKDEYKLLAGAEDVDEAYLKEVLPAKMVWNLKSIERFHIREDILTIIRTVFAVLGKEYD